MRWWLLCALILPTPAQAAVVFFSSFEYGPQAETTPYDFHYWAPQPTPAGAATATWPRVSPLPGTIPNPSGVRDRYGLHFAPASGGTSYRLWTTGIAGPIGTLTVTLGGLYVTNPGPAGTQCDLAWTGSATVRGMQVTMVSNGASVSPTLFVYATDETTTRCFGSNVDGRRCTDDSDISDECLTTNPVETSCDVPIFASSDIALNTYNNVSFQQINGSGATAGAITGNLWAGAMGASYSRGGSTVTVGECNTTALPCNVNADCTSPDTSCSLANIVGITTVGLGKQDSGTCAGDWTVSFIAGQTDAVPNPNLYAAALDPDAIPTPNTNWARGGTAHSCGDNNFPACLNDGANNGSDDDSSYLEETAPFANKPTVGINFLDAATPTAAATPIAVVLEAYGHDEQSNAAHAVGVQIMPQIQGTVKPTTGPTPIPFDFEDFVGSGGSDGLYYLTPPNLWAVTFSTSDINSLNAELKKTSGGSGDTPRITALEASVLYRTADPVVPTVLPDRDQDGQDTVCWMGDSRQESSSPQYRAAVKAGLIEPTNLYWYTRGGSTYPDGNLEMTSALEGVASGLFIPIDLQRGTAGHTCDVLLAGEGTNGLQPDSIADPQLPTSLYGVAQQGYCEANGGADQGHACLCPSGIGNETSMYHATPAPNVTPAAHYCINAGDFGNACGDSGAISVVCNCTTNADCGRGGFGTPGVCTTATAPARTPGGTCAVTGLGVAANDPANNRFSVCAAGCLHGTNCGGTGSVCVTQHTLATMFGFVTTLQAIADARPTPNPAATPAGASGRPIIVYETMPEGALFQWTTIRPRASTLRNRMRVWAKAHGYPYIDFWARIHLNCEVYQSSCADPCAYARACFRDQAHFNARGQLLMANVEIECLTNNAGDGVGTATHDGVCTGTTCTRGLYGSTCAVAADCDTWACDFGAQP